METRKEHYDCAMLVSESISSAQTKVVTDSDSSELDLNDLGAFLDQEEATRTHGVDAIGSEMLVATVTFFDASFVKS